MNQDKQDSNDLDESSVEMFLKTVNKKAIF